MAACRPLLTATLRLFRNPQLAISVLPDSLTRFSPYSVHPHLITSMQKSRNNPLNFTRFFASSSAVALEATEDEDDKLKDSIVKSSSTEVKDPKNRRVPIPWQVSVAYMKSEAYKETYGNQPVWVPYRRQHKGAIPKKHTRKTCIRRGMIVTGSPCPLCRDEYLTLDYRHTELLKQFISPHTGEVLPYLTTNICQRKHKRLRVELLKARHFGTMEFKTPFRHYDYSQYYEEEVPAETDGPLAPLAGEELSSADGTRTGLENAPKVA